MKQKRDSLRMEKAQEALIFFYCMAVPVRVARESHGGMETVPAQNLGKGGFVEGSQQTASLSLYLRQIREMNFFWR